MIENAVVVVTPSDALSNAGAIAAIVAAALTALTALLAWRALVAATAATALAEESSRLARESTVIGQHSLSVAKHSADTLGLAVGALNGVVSALDDLQANAVWERRRRELIAIANDVEQIFRVSTDGPPQHWPFKRNLLQADLIGWEDELPSCVLLRDSATHSQAAQRVGMAREEVKQAVIALAQNRLSSRSASTSEA